MNDVINLKTYLRSSSTALKQWPTEKKAGQDRNTKMWISREQKEFFWWNKIIFHNYLKPIIWLKKWKKADTR